jgi:dTDP-4-dehydrorhamnose 3,5-epimerase
VLRGLHFQKRNFFQANLVRVNKGRVLDVAVVLRENSKTFGKYFSIELTSENNEQLYFAHGFLILEYNTIFAYNNNNN